MINYRLLRRPGMLLLIWLLLTACADTDTNGTGSVEPDLVGTRWSLTAYGDPANPQPVIADYQPTLSFQEDTVGGNTGCNEFGGNYTLDGTTISFSGLFQTERACMADGVMQQEAAYMELLRNADTISRGEDSLTLTAPDSILQFTAISPA
ncbi:MAG: META domain-containing protein [Chloroflexaceae bacterium]